MGSLILCHNKKASQPYKITRIHRKIYTIEELCYYLCNNLYLIDYTIMNEKICEWLYSELDMRELAGELLDLIQKKGTIEQFVLRILEHARIYSEPEMEKNGTSADSHRRPHRFYVAGEFFCRAAIPFGYRLLFCCGES